jgi:hypothetical protein
MTTAVLRLARTLEVNIIGDPLMGKRVGLAMPDTIHAKLERWAKAEGRPVANLCSFLIERTVRDAEAAGAIPITTTVEGSK